ncbi:hypothetical protein HGRIS_014213 [Hohenbuehelia grisea]|uniref:C2H2-type domain-containing protein n=1 Tax=Hohenbuehelia grisea TaxID=104357 RepID=A0ABR3JSN1_9AGAR
MYPYHSSDPSLEGLFGLSYPDSTCPPTIPAGVFSNELCASNDMNLTGPDIFNPSIPPLYHDAFAPGTNPHGPSLDRGSPTHIPGGGIDEQYLSPSVNPLRYPHSRSYHATRPLSNPPSSNAQFMRLAFDMETPKSIRYPSLPISPNPLPQGLNSNRVSPAPAELNDSGSAQGLWNYARDFIPVGAHSKSFIRPSSLPNQSVLHSLVSTPDIYSEGCAIANRGLQIPHTHGHFVWDYPPAYPSGPLPSISPTASFSNIHSPVSATFGSDDGLLCSRQTSVPAEGNLCDVVYTPTPLESQYFQSPVNAVGLTTRSSSQPPLCSPKAPFLSLSPDTLSNGGNILTTPTNTHALHHIHGAKFKPVYDNTAELWFCNMCGKGIKRQGDVYRHWRSWSCPMRKEDGVGKGRHACTYPDCKYVTGRKDGLHRHRNIHKGDPV